MKLGDLERLVLTSGRRLEALFDAARFSLKLRLGRLDEVRVLPYRGYGSSERWYLKGRVLERKGITASAQTSGVCENLANMSRRFLSSEVPHAEVRARGEGFELDARADEEGFFELELSETLPGDADWREVEIELLRPFGRGQRGARASGSVLVPPEDAGFGVISDVDDTVVVSHATSVLKMARIVLFSNAYTRLPFDGVGRLYEALRAGRAGERLNPVFYVSSSPWNLYDVLVDFMDVHGLPPGPLFLKDWSPTVLTSHEKHKLQSIEKLLDMYPEMRFVLIGDSGEEDPEIYARVVRENPGRILAVIIRDVGSESRRREVLTLWAKMEDCGVPAKLARDSGEATEFTRSIGLIGEQCVREVYAQLR